MVGAARNLNRGWTRKDADGVGADLGELASVLYPRESASIRGSIRIAPAAREEPARRGETGRAALSRRAIVFMGPGLPLHGNRDDTRIFGLS
jgi:hypothetical protein